MRKVKKIFGDNKPIPSVQAMFTIYEALSKMSEGRLQYAQEIIHFSNSMDNLFSIWAPTYAEGIKEFTSVYKSISELNSNLAANELRVAEDIRDCYERYLAVDRIATEYNNISEQYETDSNNLINALGSELYEKRVGNYENKKESLTAAISAAKAQKKATLEAKKKSLVQYIQAKDAFNKFKVRRLKHAFTLYSTSLDEASEKEAELYQKAENILRSLKDKNLPQSVAADVERKFRC